MSINILMKVKEEAGHMTIVRGQNKCINTVGVETWGKEITWKK
jgi:hypothetical protein